MKVFENADKSESISNDMGSDFLFAKVIIDISHTSVDKEYTYIVPKNLRKEVFVGAAIRVSFGNASKLRLGYITDLSNETKLEISKLKPIDSMAKDEISTVEQLVELAIWMHKFYGCTLKKALSTVMPVKQKIAPITKKTVYIKEETIINYKEICEKLRSKRRTSWIRALEVLKENPISWEVATKEVKLSTKTLKDMENEGLIKIEEDIKVRNPFDTQIFSSKKILNEEQERAVNLFLEDYRENVYKTYLLHGITGSGKTQVYIEMLREVLKTGRQGIVLVPEISLTYQTVKRLVAEFGNRVAIVNSKLSKGERYDQFMKVLSHNADIMIGPRSAIFAPFDNIGIIIIDEEHDSAYKNENTPRFHTRDVAIKRAELSNASVVLASATPSMESYKNALDLKYKLLELKQRAISNSVLPKVDIVDLRKELESGNRSIFSRHLKELINEKLNKKEQIMLFMNRRGYSNFVSCRSCGEVIKCEHCDVSMTLHNNNKLFCHYCGSSMDMPKVCPNCKSPYIAGFGIGTQKLEVITKKEFPMARVLRLDLDTGSRKNSAKDILNKFENHEVDILIGTQMIVKGHDFSNVSLVGIMAADTSLYVNDYTATEKTFQLLTQAAGRAGRAGLDSRVVIQTYNPTHYTIVSAANQNYEEFYKQEETFRKIAKYPPFIHILTVQLYSKQEEKLEIAALEYTDMASKLGSSLEIIGPVNANVYKISDYYRKLTYIKHNDYDILLKVKEEIELLIKTNEDTGLRIFDEIGIMYDIV